MLKVGNLTQEQSNSIFSDSSSVKLLPLISAEWNQNIFNAPYLTLSGDGELIEPGSPTGATVNSVTDELLIKPNFTTKSLITSSGTASISYPITATNNTAYKIIFFAKTNSAVPLMVNSYVESPIAGSSSEEINSFGWTKIETYIGSTSAISSFNYNITFNRMSYDSSEHTVYFTVPEIYEISYFDYQYNSIYPTSSVFSNFRPGESYIPTGNNSYSFPNNHRRIKNQIFKTETLSGDYYGNKYMPVTPVINNPSFTLATVPVSVYKNVLVSDMSPYKYFISDKSAFGNPKISGIYESDIYANKIVIKFNSLITVPDINLKINGILQTVDSSTTITPDTNGILILYWTGSAWTKTKWSSMPVFNDSGVLSKITTFSKITIEQISKTTKTEFSSYESASTYVADDLTRMQVVEISPRLEIDITDYIEDFSINKSLDSQTSSIPISSINSNDASITISNIPIDKSNLFIPLFSNQSNATQTILKNMLRKNVKFYTNYQLTYFTKTSDTRYTENTSIIPAGIFYSDSWEENDVDTVTVQAYDISRYLQSTPVPDYVAKLRSVFEIITNILDLAGYTDYDYDSLYDICNDRTAPMDLAYYYCNSKDSTIIQALAEIFLAYQIGAYIDEYGIMKFLSLSKILSSQSSSLTITDNDVAFGGLSANNEQKPGKISLRYQPPKIKQSAAIQNAFDPKYVNSSSFIYTTSNDVVWSQQNIDTVGYNYLSDDFLKNENKFQINVPSQYDLFHTYNISSNGFAAIEDEIVSFSYKEYNISKSNDSDLITVSVKNNIELEAEINRYIKQYQSELIVSTLDPITNLPVLPTGYDIKVEPTGNITNVQRGLFGSKVKDHKLISTLTDKGLSQATCNSSYAVTVGGSSATPNTDATSEYGYSIEITPGANQKTLIYPTLDTDNGYKTYSTKFKFEETDVSAAGLFFNMQSTSTTDNTYFLELSRYSLEKDANDNNIYTYILALYYIDAGTEKIVAWINATSIVNKILSNLPQVFVPTLDSNDKIIGYKKQVDESFNLRIAHYPKETDPDDGEDSGELVDIFLNNIEIVGWKVPSSTSPAPATITNVVSAGSIALTFTANNTFSTGDKVTISGVNPSDYNITSEILASPSSTSFKTYGIYTTPYVSGGIATLIDSEVNSIWEPTALNPVTKLFKKISLPVSIASNSIYGSFSSTKSIASTIKLVDNYSLIPESTSTLSAYIYEIYACEKPLKQRSINYYFQDREFLNGLTQGYNLTNVKNFMVQTKPTVYGINYYDIQYPNPAATSVDVLPVQYLLQYFPGDAPGDQKYIQKLTVDEHSVSYSTAINTGFRARMAIANSVPHLVFLNKDPDITAQSDIKLNIWTHEIVAPSDQEIIEKVIDYSNISETLQLDSEWIQSKEAAYKTLNIVEKAIDSFSKNISLEIFGNPLIQIGDVITLTYRPSAINAQKYVVKSISQSFNSGLSTQIELSMLQGGVPFSGQVGPTYYSISYNGNTNTGGTAPTDSNNYVTGNSVTVLSQNTLSKTNYTFVSWNTQADGNGISYLPGSTITVQNSNITLYAIWQSTLTSGVTSQPTTYSPLGEVGELKYLSAGTSDDGYITIVLPFAITYNDTTTNIIYVGTNGYVTFDAGYTTYNPSETDPGVNKIHINAGDRVLNSLYYLNNTTSWSIRYNAISYGTSGNSIIWEISSTVAAPNILKIHNITENITTSTTIGAFDATSLLANIGSAGTATNIITTV